MYPVSQEQINFVTSEGYYASNCVCSDETTCDGTEVDLDTRTCSAYHKGDSFPLIKEATMVSVLNLKIGSCSNEMKLIELISLDVVIVGLELRTNNKTIKQNNNCK